MKVDVTKVNKPGLSKWPRLMKDKENGLYCILGQGDHAIHLTDGIHFKINYDFWEPVEGPVTLTNE